MKKKRKEKKNVDNVNILIATQNKWNEKFHAWNTIQNKTKY